MSTSKPVFLRVCAAPGCNRAAAGRYCEQHRVSLGRSVYNRKWRDKVRPAVLARDGKRCRYCGEGPRKNEPLHVAHVDETQELVREGRDVHDLDRLLTAHVACHNAHAPHLTQGGGVPQDNAARRLVPRSARGVYGFGASFVVGGGG